MSHNFANYIYSLAADPDGLEDFLQAMLRAYTDVLHGTVRETAGEIEGEVARSLEDVETHIERVASIFDRFDWSGYDDDVLDGGGRSGTACEFKINSSNVVTEVSGEKSEAVGISVGMRLEDLPVDWDELERFRVWQRKRTGFMQGNHAFLLPLRGSSSYPPMLLSATKVNAGQRSSDIVFESLELIWDDAAGTAIAEVFRLTDAESDILRSLVSGKTLNEIAEERHRSIQTVRTQASTLLRKTAAKSQINLVRIFSAISAHLKENEDVLDRSLLGFGIRSEFIEVEPDRHIQVDLCGPEDGLPIVLLHGLSTGTSFTREVNEELYRQNLRLIAPYRPHYGGSSGVKCSFEDYPKRIAEDVRYVMKHYGVERTVLLGRFSGGLFAVAAANELGDAVAGIFGASITPPYRNIKMLDEIQPVVRVFAYSARYFPKIIPVLVRGVLLKILSTDEKTYLKKWYSESPADARCIESDELRQLIAKHWHSSFGQSTKGYEVDVRYTSIDWSPWLKDLKQPIHLVHGAEDPTTIIAHIRDLVADFEHLTLQEVEGGGQLLFHTHTRMMVNELAQFARRHLGLS